MGLDVVDKFVGTMPSQTAVSTFFRYYKTIQLLNKDKEKKRAYKHHIRHAKSMQLNLQSYEVTHCDASASRGATDSKQSLAVGRHRLQSCKSQTTHRCKQFQKGAPVYPHKPPYITYTNNSRKLACCNHIDWLFAGLHEIKVTL